MRKFIANFLLVIIITTGFSTFAQATTVSNVRIMNSSYKCLDIANGQFWTAGTPIVQYDCHNGYSQRFSIEQINSGGHHLIRSYLNPNMCVGTPNNVHANSNELLRLVPCRLNYDFPRGVRFFLVNVNSTYIQIQAVLVSSDNRGTCIDVPSGDSRNSIWLQFYYCHNGNNQLWRISPTTRLQF